MAFTASTFALATPQQNSGLPRIFVYTTPDLGTDVDTSGYFNDKADDLKVGDLIYAALDTDGTPTYGLAVVLSNTGTVVDISNFTALGGADTD